SLFADARLVLLRDADQLKKKEDLDLLAACLASPPADTTLILISVEFGVSKILEKVIPPEHRRVFWELDEGRKTEWVEEFFRRDGYGITAGGIETILELVENNTGALRRECTRLKLFFGKGELIDEEGAERWLSHTREESAFTLFSRIVRGDREKSLESLRTLLAAKESAQSIIAGLVWCFRKFREYLALVNPGPAGEFEYKKIGLASRKKRQDYIEAGRRFGSAGPCLSLLADYDRRTRAAGTIWETMLMDNLVCGLLAMQQGPRVL
ncbi:MAG: DNA polymerase III subunit delta, partial [Treponema sp.]|nr:DNA polymerase III subunit delta [Treponema sp.]